MRYCFGSGTPMVWPVCNTKSEMYIRKRVVYDFAVDAKPHHAARAQTCILLGAANILVVDLKEELER